MLSKFFSFFLFSFVLVSLCLFVDANQIKYEISTQNPQTPPYYFGTTITDLKISFLDTDNNVLAQNIVNLEIKVGAKRFFLLKEKDNTYHLKNQQITEDLINETKLIVNIITPLEGSFTNIKQTYNIDSIDNIISLKTDPKENYKNLTIGQTIDLKLEFEDLKNQGIKNLKCYLNSFGSKEKFDCTKKDICNYKLTITLDTNTIPIYCLFDKTTSKGTKIYPLNVLILPNISEGIKIGEITNPKDRVIGNPFEICFTVLYQSNTLVKEVGLFKIFEGEEEIEYYKRDNDFCFSQFLIPYTTLQKEISFEFLGKKYLSKINQDLKPGTYWTIFLIVIGILILINLLLIIKAVFSKDSIEDLTLQRDNYKNKLKEIKEKYLQGEIEKKEFDSKLNEYSIKISFLNERLLHMKKHQPNLYSSSLSKEESRNEEEGRKPRKASKELMEAIFTENKEDKIKANEEDLFVDETLISDESIKKLSKELSESSIISDKPKEENKFAAFFKNLKNLFKKKTKETTDIQKETNEEQEPEEAKETFQGYSTEDEYDIRKWQK